MFSVPALLSFLLTFVLTDTLSAEGYWFMKVAAMFLWLPVVIENSHSVYQVLGSQ